MLPTCRMGADMGSLSMRASVRPSEGCSSSERGSACDLRAGMLEVAANPARECNGDDPDKNISWAGARGSEVDRSRSAGPSDDTA